MKKQVMAVMAAGLMMLGLAGTAQASLVVAGTVDSGVYAGVQVINDTDLNITWLDYSNAPQSWANQVAWAGSLSLTVNGQTYGDWRLPSTVDGPYVSGYDGTTMAGFNITTSEMGHLFYTELGNKGQYDTAGSLQSDSGLTNIGDFKNLASWYWSGTEYAVNQNDAWYFLMVSGYQGVDYKVDNMYGLAVRSGQISAVPAPASMLLLGAGLSGLLAVRRKQDRRVTV